LTTIPAIGNLLLSFQVHTLLNGKLVRALALFQYCPRNGDWCQAVSG